MPSFHDRNWTKFWLHFTLGAVVGIAVGFGIFAQSEHAASTSESNTPLILILSLSALAFGLLGGIFGDELWTQLHRWF